MDFKKMELPFLTVNLLFSIAQNLILVHKLSQPKSKIGFKMLFVCYEYNFLKHNTTTYSTV